MQENTVEKAVRICVEAAKLDHIIQPINLEWLRQDQRPSFLAAVRSYGVNYPNVAIVDESYVVFHGDEDAARMFLVTLYGEADRLESDVVQRHVCALCFAMEYLSKPALIFSGPERERQEFFSILRREGSCLNPDFLIKVESHSRRASQHPPSNLN